MDVTARSAAIGDIPELVRLYRLLESEMIQLEKIWATAAGLPEPTDQAFMDTITDTGTSVLIGSIDRVPLGLLLGYGIKSDGIGRHRIKLHPQTISECLIFRHINGLRLLRMQ